MSEDFSNGAKVICHEFSHQFSKAMNKAYWTKVLHLDGVDLLGQQGEEGSVKQPELEHMTLMNIISDHLFPFKPL